MIKLELTDEDAQVLKRYLESEIPDLRAETSATHSYEFKGTVRAEREALERVLEQLQEVGQPL